MLEIEEMATRTRIYDRKRELLEYLLEEEGVEMDPRQVIHRRASEAELPLSFAQQRFWFLDQLERGTHYNDHLGLRFTGSLDIEALEASINEIVKRHEMLRTTFVMIDERPGQVVHDHTRLSIRRIDLREFPASEREAQAVRQATIEIRRPFDLAQGPLLRCTLMRMAKDDFVFFLAIHQIVNDGWSLSVFLREMVEAYEAFSNGRRPDLPELPVQYADFAIWQRERFQEEALAPHLRYWKQQLSGELSVLELPADHSRPAVPSFRGARHYLEFSGPLIWRLKDLCQREEATLFMLFLAAFKTLIYRYTGLEDIMLGFPFARRNQVETENLIGIFINPLVLRTDMSGDPTFVELLAQVRKVALDAYAHQDLPFEKLVETLHPHRELSHAPLFQILFDYNNVPLPGLKLPALSVNRFRVDGGTSKFDLSLELTESSDDVLGWFEYSTDLFESDTIVRMAGHLHRLIEAIASDPEQRISALPLLTDAELRQMVVEWNETGAAYPARTCIHDLFEAQVERTSEAVAVICGEGSLSYRELNDRANRLAHYLKRQGVGPNVPVGVCMERSLDMMVGLLGILKAGGAFLPVDPAYPQKRVAFMLEDSNVSLLLTQARLVEKLPDYAGRLIRLDEDLGLIAKESGDRPDSGTAPEDLAYVTYTSGSSGTPKGVLGLHRGAVNRFNWMWQTYPFESGEVCCAKASLSFVDSIWEIFGPMLRGTPVVVIPEETVKDVGQFVQVLSDQRVTRIVLVPSLLRVLLDNYNDLRRRVPALKYWVTSGESLPLDLCRRFLKCMPGSILINLYGCSEVSADSLWHETEMDSSLSSVPIGRPIFNTRIYILDRRGNPVPVGVPGELHVGGEGLARGYLNRPELTRDRFIPDAFNSGSGNRLYRTGDLARYLPGGNVEYLGRLDRQLKIRGYRIEPGEIQTALMEHPAVKDALVRAREDEAGNKGLVAYLILNQKELPPVSEVRGFLKQRLPDYMVPSAYVFLDSFPQTPNGKLDINSLETPGSQSRERARAFESPRNVLEQQLARIWEKVLGIRPVGVTDNFFDLGGHSLLAARLFAQIERVFGRKLPLATLFQAPTIEQLSRVLEEKGWTPPWSSLVPINPGGSRLPFYCVHAAGGNVLLYRDLARRLGPDQPVYGLQALGLFEGRPHYTRVEEMAAHYIKEIRILQPEGPYLLGGRCMGGYIALEMAQQLHAQGQKVNLLAILDSGPPNTRNSSVQRSFRKPMNHYFHRFFHHLQHGQLTHTMQQWIKDRHTTRKILNRLRTFRAERFWSSELRHLHRFEKANSKAVVNYTARIYPGRITLIRSSEFKTLKRKDWHLSWSNLAAGGFECHEVPVTHLAMLEEPYVQILADKLKACLDDAQSKL